MTLRELLWAAEARQTDEWSRTAHVLAVLININRDPRRRQVAKPEDLMPQKRRRKVEPMKTDISALKMFLKGT